MVFTAGGKVSGSDSVDLLRIWRHAPPIPIRAKGVAASSFECVTFCKALLALGDDCLGMAGGC